MDLNVDEWKLKDDVMGWGKSSSVPSVQEMVRKVPNAVPQRYIRGHHDRQNHIDGSNPASPKLPEIDFSLLVNGDEEQKSRLDFACKEFGFCQIINHGVTDEVLKKMKTAAADFFDLPLEEKMKYAMEKNDVQGYGQAFVVSEEQKLDWNDLDFLLAYPPEYRNMKFWPLTIPGFEEAADQYSQEIHRVSEGILSHLSLLLGAEKGCLQELHQGIKLGLRMNYYPPCSRPDLVLGLSPHSDTGSISLLLQDDDITALQIKHKGEWLPVEPLPGALVFNVGDVLEIWSNGMYKSTEHRAVANSSKSRISTAIFVFPDNEAEIGPLEPMVRHSPAMYRNIKFVDYMRNFLGNKLDGKSHTEVVKIQSM